MINTSHGVNTVFQQGVSGMNSSSRSMVESANDLVRAGTVERAPTSTTDIVEPLVEINKQQHVFTASAHVVSVADEALGALIDVSA